MFGCSNQNVSLIHFPEYKLILKFVNFTHRFLGNVFASFLNEFIETGKIKPKILDDGFNFERWAKSKSKKPDDFITKKAILGFLVEFIVQATNDYIEYIDLAWLLNQRLRQFLKLRLFLKSNGKYKDEIPICKEKMKILDQLLLR